MSTQPAESSPSVSTTDVDLYQEELLRLRIEIKRRLRESKESGRSVTTKAMEEIETLLTEFRQVTQCFKIELKQLQPEQRTIYQEWAHDQELTMLNIEVSKLRSKHDEEGDEFSSRTQRETRKNLEPSKSAIDSLEHARQLVEESERLADECSSTLQQHMIVLSSGRSDFEVAEPPKRWRCSMM